MLALSVKRMGLGPAADMACLTYRMAVIYQREGYGRYTGFPNRPGKARAIQLVQTSPGWRWILRASLVCKREGAAAKVHFTIYGHPMAQCTPTLAMAVCKFATEWPSACAAFSAPQAAVLKVSS